MDNKDYKKFYLIREDVLPESVVKTLKIKDALKSDPTLSIYDAVKQFDLSRSAFYKYRETIFPVDDKMLDHREFICNRYCGYVGTCTRCYIKVRTICINDSSKYSNGRKSNNNIITEC
ncbi:ACT domain-containing protein [Staphylococcus aureus]|nr:ACT domain-containing protein [Staphylococcus aureus]